MKITVKFFALGRELIGRSELEMELPEQSTVQSAIDQLKENHHRFGKLNSFMTAVNMEYANPTTELKNGDELAIIPPVSGG